MIHDGALVGSGSVVLHHAEVHTGATVAAGAVVRNRTHVPEGALAVGVPATIKEGASDRDAIAEGAALYVANGQRYKTQLRVL